MNSTYNSTDFSFNHGFWLLLKKSIMLHKDSTSLKEKILVAKRILTPIIQDLMTDALVQTEIEKLSKFDKNRKIDGKNIKILFNKVKSDETGCFEGSQSDNEWATKILMEINRDLEEPFDKVLVEKHRRLLEDPVNETLLEKLISVYQHLGEIIEQLKNRCSIKSEQVYIHASKNKDVKLFTSDLQVSFEKGTENIADSVDTNAELEIPKCKCHELDSNIFDDTIKHQVINYQCSYNDLYALDSQPKTNGEQNIHQTFCRTDSVICLRRSEERDELVTTSDQKSAANSFCERPTVESDIFHAGKKEIVKKCLEGLDKVKTYLQSLCIDEEGDDIQLSVGEKQKHEDCLENRRECLVLKQQEDTGRNHNTFNYRTVDVLSVHPDTNKKGYDSHKPEKHFDSETSRQIHPFAESRIPKPIHKKRGDTTGKGSCSDLKVILRNGVDSQQKITNLVIFNPDDPCKSIIKMKDHENLAAANSNAGVSKIMKSSEMKIRIIFLCGKRYDIEKEIMRNPLWSRIQKLESTRKSKFKHRFYQERLDLVVMVEILFQSEFYKIQRVFRVTALRKDFIILLQVYESSQEYEGFLTISSYFEYGNFLNEEGLQTFRFLMIKVFIYHRKILETHQIHDKYGAQLPVSEFSKLLKPKQHFCCENVNFSYLSEKQIVQYMKNLYRFTSFLKGNLTQDKYQYHQENKKIFFKTIFEELTNEFPKLNYAFQTNLRNENYHTYFFSYSVRSGGEEQLYSSDEIDDRCNSLSTYPIWRIKKSKYYNLPSKKGGVSLTEPKLTEDSSKDNKVQLETKSYTELSTSIVADESLEQKLSDNQNYSTKSEVKRKVSFKDDVNFDRRGKCNKEGFEYGFDNSKSKETISSDSLDILKNDDELAELLMRDSLMVISSSSLQEHCTTTNQSEKKEYWRNLELTNSAEVILSKLTRSFDYRDEDRYPTLETKNRRPNSKVLKCKQSLPNRDRIVHENQNAEIEEENIKKSDSQLFNLIRFVDSHKYKKEAKLIEEKFMNEKKVFENIKTLNNNIQNKEVDEIIPYYDCKAKPIEDVYDEYGNRIELLGKHVSSEIFDINGNLRTHLYTKTGKKIKVIYNSNGELLKTLSRPKIKFELPRTDKIKNVPSISQLFEEDNIELGEENIKRNVDDGSCSKNYSDLDGSLLEEGYHQKNKTSTVTAPEEIGNGKKQYLRRIDSKTPEMTTNFERPEARKSEVSISWLNELLTASKVFARKKRDSIFRKKSKLRPDDLKVIYDDEDNIINRIYDCEGNLLAESPSGNAERLIPFLFDNSGAFIDGRFISEKRELKFVFDSNKNMIRSISVTTLNEVLSRVSENRKKHNMESKFNKENATARQKLSGTNDATFEKTMSQEKVMKQEKYIRQLFDEKGNLLTAIYDEKGKQLEIDNPELASNLSPYLFDFEGRSNHYYDAAGHKLGAIYDENGNIVKNMIISLTHLNKEPCVSKTSTDKNLFTKIKNYSELVDKIISLDKDCELQAEKTHKEKSENNLNRSRKNISEHKKFKLEKDKSELSHKIPSTSERSMSRLHAINNNSVDKYLKSSTSVNGKYDENNKINTHKQLQRKGKYFYDVDGNEIRQVYKGREMMKVKSGEADKLAPFIFDRNGFLRENIVDQYGRRIVKIYDYKGREIRRTAVKSISSEQVVGKMKKTEEKRRQVDVYDRNGNLVRELCDRSGRQLVLTKSIQMEDLSSFIFHANGNRRRVYDKNGHEIGPLYDHKGNLLKYLPTVKELKKKEVQHYEIFSKSGRKLNNFYDSEGTFIIALYDDDARLICSIEKGQNNASILSRYLFDDYGRFLKGRYLDFRGSRIKRVYDSMDNIVHSIIKSYPQKSPPRERSHHARDSKRSPNNHYSASKMNKESIDNYKHRQKVPSDRNGKKRSESLINVTSQSDVDLKIKKPKLRRPISAYFLKEPRVEYDTPLRQSCSSSSVLMKTETFGNEKESKMIECCQSKNTLLRHFSSGVFGVTNSISGQQNVKFKQPLVLNESSGKTENMAVKMKTNVTFSEVKGYTKSNVHGTYDEKIVEKSHKHPVKPANHSIDGSFIENFTVPEGDHFLAKERNSFDYFDRKSKKEHERSRQAKIHHRKRLPFFTNLKDKFLTAVFENLNPYCKHTTACSKKIEKIQQGSVIFEKLKEKHKSIEEIVSKSGLLEVACKTKNKINFQLHKKRKMRNCDNKERKMCDLRSRCRIFGTSGDLGSKACNTRRSISTIYTNEKLLKKLHDHQNPAKVDSDLIYVVSKQSLPAELIKPICPVFTQMNFNTEGANYYALDDFTTRAYSKKRTSECICQQCQGEGRNKNLMGKFGDEFMNKLSKLTVPFDKLLTKNVSFKEEKDGTDSLEALINNAFTNKMDQNIGFPEQKSCSSSCVAFQLDDTIPVSRKIIQETLLACVHLNNSSEVIGKLSNMMLRHFTTSIMREIKRKFFRKLNALQYRKATSDESSIFESETVKEDICVGTELKFEDPQIVKHNIIQTEQKGISNNCSQRLNKAVSVKSAPGYLEEMPSKYQCTHTKMFICKLPNTQPFSFTMKTINDSKHLFEKNNSNEVMMKLNNKNLLQDTPMTGNGILESNRPRAFIERNYL